jgi:predicted ribosomally synthesized peptide with nif11-like leader
MNPQNHERRKTMSIESAKAFFERVKNDEDFRNSVGENTTTEERVEFVKKAGFDFTKEEIEKHTSELSEEELDKVSGGGWFRSEGCGGAHLT